MLNCLKVSRRRKPPKPDDGHAPALSPHDDTPPITADSKSDPYDTESDGESVMSSVRGVRNGIHGGFNDSIKKEIAALPDTGAAHAGISQKTVPHTGTLAYKPHQQQKEWKQPGPEPEWNLDMEAVAARLKALGDQLREEGNSGIACRMPAHPKDKHEKIILNETRLARIR